MEIEYNYTNNNFNNNSEINSENLVNLAPNFYLNKCFPNHYNLSIEDVIQNFLKSKYDLLENKQLTTSLSKEFNLLFSSNSKLSNNDDNNKKILFNNQQLSQKFLKLENLNKNNNNIEKKEKDNEDNFNKINISKKNEYNKINSFKKKNNLCFLSDYNIYSCTENNKCNNKENVENYNSDEKNIIFINSESLSNNNNNSYIKNKDYENIFDNLFKKKEFDKTKEKKNEIKIENENIIIKNNKKEINKEYQEIKKKENNKKSNINSSSKNKFKIKKKKIKENNLTTTTKAASLMKDIRKEYKFKSTLGGGHFGTVRKAYKKSDREITKYYAIKSIPMKNLSSNIEDFVKEVDIISTLDHPNIIKFYETYHDKCFFHIVMELCKGKEILHQMTNDGHMDEKKVVNIILKVLLAIAHCHNRGITHRDLKPENILFDSLKPDAEIKLIDFGLSRKYDKEQKMHSILGTPYYVAPEVLKGEYDEKCDIWSIGAVTYLLLCGEPPFTGNSNNEIFKKIVNENVKFNFYRWKNISNNAKDFVRICLNKNGNKRPSASEALKHPWFINVLKETHNINNIKKEILLNIKNFNINYEFKQMVLKYLINFLTEEEKKVYKESFYAVDFNHSGFIRPQELKQAYDLMKIDITQEQINYLFDILPKNKKLGMGYSEFIMAGVDQKKLFTKENLEDSFNYFDINKTGFIEYDNLNSALLRMGKKYVNSDDINSIINDVIKNIKHEEFQNKEKFYKISKDDFMKIFLDK